MLYAGALFESELSLAVGTTDITVRLKVPYLHMLSLEKIRDRAVNTQKAVVLIHTLSDVGRQRAQYRYRCKSQNYYYQYGCTDKEEYPQKQVDDIQYARHYPDKSIQLVVSVSPAHELGDLHKKITHTVTFGFYMNTQCFSRYTLKKSNEYRLS